MIGRGWPFADLLRTDCGQSTVDSHSCASSTSRAGKTGKGSRTAAVELLTVEEAAASLRAPAATLRYWRHLGVGRDGFRLGRRVVYRREDVNH